MLSYPQSHTVNSAPRCSPIRSITPLTQHRWLNITVLSFSQYHSISRHGGVALSIASWRDLSTAANDLPDDYINLDIQERLRHSVREAALLFQGTGFIFCPNNRPAFRSQWHWSAASRLFGLQVRNPSVARLSILNRVLSGRGLCNGLITHSGESYRMWCVSVMVKPWQWEGAGPTGAAAPWKTPSCLAILYRPVEMWWHTVTHGRGSEGETG